MTRSNQRRRVAPSHPDPDVTLRHGWGDPIGPARQRELERLQQAWGDKPESKPGPFAGVQLSGADVYWLAVHALARRDGDISDAEDTLRGAQAISGTVPQYRTAMLALGPDLSELNLCHADLAEAQLENAVLSRARLSGANLSQTNLQGACLFQAQLDGARFSYTQLHGAILVAADLTRATFFLSDLCGANFGGARLHRADLMGEDLRGVVLNSADLRAADLRQASFDAATSLDDALFDQAKLDHAIFENANLTVVNWELVRTLGDELEACNRLRAPKRGEGADDTVRSYADLQGKKQRQHVRKTAEDGVEEYVAAARAYNLLATLLNSQGVAKYAFRFRYKARVMERKAAFHAVRIDARSPNLSSLLFVSVPRCVTWLTSWLVDLLSGYGYRFGRLVRSYVVTVFVYAAIFLLIAHWPLSGPALWASIRHPAAWIGRHAGELSEVFVLSITSFHGRGWLQTTSPGLMSHPAAGIAAATEAVIGLVIEALLVASLLRWVTRE